MKSISVEAVVAILCLLVALPPTILVLYRMYSRGRRRPGAINAADGNYAVVRTSDTIHYPYTYRFKAYPNQHHNAGFTMTRRQTSYTTEMEVIVATGTLPPQHPTHTSPGPGEL